MNGTEKFAGASGERKTERMSHAEKMRSYLAGEHPKLAKEFAAMQEGIPEEERLTLAPDFRIVPPSALYSDREKNEIRSRQLEFLGIVDEKMVRAEEDKSGGVVFEMLKTAIMHKRMGSRYIVVRASLYDDIKNGVDNVIVEKATGYTVCALDELSSRGGRDPELVKKAGEILQKNWGVNVLNEQRFGAKQEVTGEQGAKLKYGISLENGRMRSAEVRHLPIFLLNLDREQLDEGINRFNLGEEPSLYEKELFDMFLAKISGQIKQMKSGERYLKLPQEMRTRIESFESFLAEQKK